MSLIAADINDAGITFLSQYELLYCEPGFALLDNAELALGSEAFRKSRLLPRHINAQFWSHLSA
jgi:hypothetical protein